MGFCPSWAGGIYDTLDATPAMLSASPSRNSSLCCFRCSCGIDVSLLPTTSIILQRRSHILRSVIVFPTLSLPVRLPGTHVFRQSRSLCLSHTLSFLLFTFAKPFSAPVRTAQRTKPLLPMSRLSNENCSPHFIATQVTGIYFSATGLQE